MEHVTEYLTVRGTKIRLLKGGKGQPLLFLHGINGGGNGFQFLMLYLSNIQSTVQSIPVMG